MLMGLRASRRWPSGDVNKLSSASSLQTLSFSKPLLFTNSFSAGEHSEHPSVRKCEPAMLSMHEVSVYTHSDEPMPCGRGDRSLKESRWRSDRGQGVWDQEDLQALWRIGAQAAQSESARLCLRP